MNYYNENDRKAAAWIRELIKQKLIPEGEVDERSITEVQPEDVQGFVQAHFFAGICGWPLALSLAGWPDSKPVWTGSCPCQPFSTAGKGKGVADERHLWPAFKWLIHQCSPPVVFGEQVASPAGREWLSGVRADLEGVGYAVGAADLCAAGVGSPHIRQRLYWVADAELRGRERITKQHSTGLLETVDGKEEPREPTGTHSTSTGGVADTPGMSGPQQLDEPRSGTRRGPSPVDAAKCAGSCGMGNANGSGLSEQRGPVTVPAELSTPELRGHTWDTFDILPCTDGKARRIESGTFPLVARIPTGVVPSGDPSATEAQASGENRSARLKGYGNSIVPQLAAVFIIASTEQYRTI